LLAALDGFERVIEVGVGRRPDVAMGLAARGVSVTATDIVARETPGAVTFVRDDVTDPTLALYADTDLIYAVNCPPELQGPMWDLARRVDAACRFTTLGTDPPVVPAEPHQLPGETLYVAQTARD
jgi:uncharacterized UPF0146 family protein